MVIIENTKYESYQQRKPERNPFISPGERLISFHDPQNPLPHISPDFADPPSHFRALGLHVGPLACSIGAGPKVVFGWTSRQAPLDLSELSMHMSHCDVIFALDNHFGAFGDDWSRVHTTYVDPAKSSQKKTVVSLRQGFRISA